MTGQRIAQFQLIEKIGEGGMGVVWKARDTRRNRHVVLKLLPPAKTADPDRRQRFIKKAQTASAINHPNIVTIYDINESGGEHFIAMELVPGHTLEKMLSGRPLRVVDSLKLAVQIADALAATHEAGIVRRDSKPKHVSGFPKRCLCPTAST